MTAEKDVQVARKKGRGGGEEIWAMPERKHFFSKEVFPKELLSKLSKSFCISTYAFNNKPPVSKKSLSVL